MSRSSSATAPNDKAGHAAGDRLLCHFAQVLRTGLRPADTLYRWGGDELHGRGRRSGPGLATCVLAFGSAA